MTGTTALNEPTVRDSRTPPAGARPLPAGVIGLGVGAAHAAAYAEHAGSVLVGVCDFSAEAAQRVASQHPGTRVYADADELLDDPEIDVVSIASYDNHHYEQIARAIERGKHVFVEKPLCLRAEEARRIRALLRAHPDVQLSSNLVLRACPRFAALRERVGRGELGELFWLEGDYHYGRLHKITAGWRGAIDFYSVVCGGAIHIVDLLMWLGGGRVREVCAYGNRIASRGSPFRFNDAVVAALRFDSGAIGKVGVTYGCVKPHFHALSVFGTAGTFVNGEPAAALYTSRDPDTPPGRIDDAYPGATKGALIPSFIDAIAGGGAPLVSAEDVFASMSVCLAIEESVQTGRPCPVAYI